jgi:hypothetical protein
MVEVVVRHQSGHWSEVGSPAYVNNLKELRTRRINGHVPTAISRTEQTDQSVNKVYRRVEQGIDDGWAWFHPKFPDTNRWVDCSLEWDTAAWMLQDHGLRVLSDFRVETTGGVLLLPSTMPWVLLESRLQKNWLMLLSAAHNNLDNTPKRAAAWVEEGGTFKAFQKRKAAHHRGLHRVHQCDANKNIRQVHEARMMRTGMLWGTGLHWGWNVDRLPSTGTHRDPAHSIIDYSLSNMVCSGSTRVGGNTGFSDHNWIETIWKG